jgi:hypothetical protein
MKVHETQVRLKLNWTHQLMVCADNMGDNIDAVKKYTDTLIDVSKNVGLVLNTEKNKYILLSRHHKTGQIRDIKIRG